MSAFDRPVLVLDASSGASGRGGARCVAAIVGPAADIRAQMVFDGPGGATRLAAALPSLLEEAGLAFAELGAVACVCGPGSFTGLRATLALAQGLCDGLTVPLFAVTVGEAFGVGADPGLWVATMARRGRVFVERQGAAPASFDLIGGVPAGWGVPLQLAGDGAEALAALWRGVAIEILPGVGPDVLAIARAARQRFEGALPPRDALPLYVDAPEAKLPASAMRANG